jgi:hypothetical protein
MGNLAPAGQRVPRVLYFIAGMVPTDEQKNDAARFGPNVGIRNALQVATLAMSPLEECDAVAGPDVPDRYAKVYPNVQGLDLGARLLRMSDFDREHGPVHGIDNESARAAKPPAFGQDHVVSQGAVRAHGAMTLAGGGFVAPLPGDPNNVQAAGSERAENAPEGAAGQGTQGAFNPQALPDKGVTLPGPAAATDQLSGAVAQGGGSDGFRAPEPVKDEDEDGPKSKRKRGETGSTGDTGPTGATGSTGAAA